MINIAWRRSVSLFGVLPALLSAACTPVSGYSNLQARLRNSSQVALIAYETDPTKPVPAPGTKGLHYLRPVTVLPAGRDYQEYNLESDRFKVELRREHGGIRYSTNVNTSGVLLGDPEIRPVTLTLAQIEALDPATKLEWQKDIDLGSSNFEFTREGTTHVEHSMYVDLSTTWANVHQVTGREVKSPVLPIVLISTAVASYLVGAGLIALQLKTWKDNEHLDGPQKKEVSVPMIGLGSGLILLGIPLIIFGVKDARRNTVSVYGEAKGQRIKLPR